MSKFRDLSKVRILLDKDGYLILAGHPAINDKTTKKEIDNCIAKEGTVKTISIEEFRETKWRWVYDKLNWELYLGVIK